MQEGKTIGQLMEEMRQKAGAQNYHGHDYMDLQRFAENTRHMIIFDVLTNDSPVGWKGERTRLFLSDIGYVVCDTAKVKIEGMMPYLIKFFLALIAGVLVVTYVPQLSLLFVHLFGQ